MFRCSCAISFLFLSLPASAEDPAQPSQAEMMKKWQKFSAPNENHKLLDPLVGEWDVVTKVWGGPGTKPISGKGTATYKWILGGRQLKQDFTGTVMGMKTTGTGMTGYDNFKKKYTSVWTDTMTTATMLSEGVLSRDKKTITFYGKMDEFLTGEHDKPVRYVLHFAAKDKVSFEIHDLSIGKGSKVMELTYTRKKNVPAGGIDNPIEIKPVPGRPVKPIRIKPIRIKIRPVPVKPAQPKAID